MLSITALIIVVLLAHPEPKTNEYLKMIHNSWTTVAPNSIRASPSRNGLNIRRVSNLFNPQDLLYRIWRILFDTSKKTMKTANVIPDWIAHKWQKFLAQNV